VEEVVFESPRVSIPRKVLASLGAGLAMAALGAFARWGFHPGHTGRSAVPMALLGAVVSLGMLLSAVLGRTVRRVAVEGGTLRLYRDPDAVETIPLGAVRGFGSEPVIGGWSRNPSERLVVELNLGPRRVFSLPDEADTAGIVRDLEALRGAAQTIQEATNATPEEGVG
jgi:hypothetical protein